MTDVERGAVLAVAQDVAPACAVPTGGVHREPDSRTLPQHMGEREDLHPRLGELAHRHEFAVLLITGLRRPELVGVGSGLAHRAPEHTRLDVGLLAIGSDLRQRHPDVGLLGAGADPEIGRCRAGEGQILLQGR